MAQQRGPVELAPTVARYETALLELSALLPCRAEADVAGRNEVCRADVGGVAHFCKYAEAIYGWPLYVNANPCRCFKVRGAGTDLGIEVHKRALT